jgi:hypothetical protein
MRAGQPSFSLAVPNFEHLKRPKTPTDSANAFGFIMISEKAMAALLGRRALTY